MDLGPFPEAEGFDTATQLDHQDPIASHRDRYAFPDPDLIYLDGNSLGRLPIATATIVEHAVDKAWGNRLIRSWNDGWWDLQLRLGDMLAPLIGAGPGEVIISDSTSVNLHKLALAAMQARPGRSTIVTDDLNFPTDLYVLGSVARATEGRLEIVASDGINGPIDALAAAVDNDTALVSLSHTVFKSGYTYDVAAITEMAHRAGAMVLWDTSHSVGVVPVDLGSAGADLAVGCTYKYLNGGPGAPAFLYVRKDLQSSLKNPIEGWWGHESPFSFDPEYRPVVGIRRFHAGTMPILSMAAIEGGLTDVLDAGIERIRAKSTLLTSFLIELLDTHLAALGFELSSPRDATRRGSHVSLTHERAWPITRTMIDVGSVIPDFRAPDNLRLGLSPLYTRFIDVHTAVLRIKTIIENGLDLEMDELPRATVT